MAQNKGTLVTSAVRINDDRDPYASVYANEARGGLHTRDTIAQRNAMGNWLREWGMLCAIGDHQGSSTIYQLVEGFVDSDINNNSNWKVFVGGASAVTAGNGIIITGTPANPIIGIAPGYIGQSSITTLGTITTGTWQGTPIDTAHGGTGLTVLGNPGDLIRVKADGTGLEYFPSPYLTGNQTITLNGDITGSGTTAINTTIAPNAVTTNKINNLAVTIAKIGAIGTPSISTFLRGDGQWAPIGGGTVGSFAAGNLPPLFTTVVSSATTNPSLAFSLNNQVANTGFYGPVSGASAAPTFRAMVSADIPSGIITIPKLSTTGTPASNTYLNGLGQWVVLNNSSFTSPLTQKGDILSYGTVDTRLPVGTDTNVLIADSSQTLGLRYGTIASALGYTPLNKAGDTMTGPLILSSDPTTALGAVTKQYVDSLSISGGGKIYKAAVQAASTGNLTLSGNQTIDGVVNPTYVLAKDQSDPTQNGIWATGSGAWTRRTDSDTGAEIINGFVTVLGGTVNANTLYTTTTINPPTIGTDPIIYTQLPLPGAVTAGDGITVIGNVVAVDTSVARLAGIQTFTGLKTFTGGISINNGSDVTGQIYYRNSSGNVVGLNPGTAGQSLMMNGGLPTWQSVVTTKGDIYGFSTVPTRRSVGSNGQLLVSDSSDATGLTWRSITSIVDYAYITGLLGTTYESNLGNPSVNGQVLSKTTSGTVSWVTLPTTGLTTIAGTLNRIVVTNPTTSPVINIDPAYAGQNSITTLGTITTGVWNGTLIGTTYGGTGLSAIGTSNQLIRVKSDGSGLEYFTPAYLTTTPTITLNGDVTGSGTNTITTLISNNAINTAKLADASVTISKINASGTPDLTKYLAGNGAWISFPTLDFIRRTGTIPNSPITGDLAFDTGIGLKSESVPTNIIKLNDINHGNQLTVNSSNGINLFTGDLAGFYSSLSVSPTTVSYNLSTGEVFSITPGAIQTNVGGVTFNFSQVGFTIANSVIHPSAGSWEYQLPEASGTFALLSDIPTPVAQVNSDWNSTSGSSLILNKPDLNFIPYTGTATGLAVTGDLALANDVKIKSYNNPNNSIIFNYTGIGEFSNGLFINSDNSIGLNAPTVAFETGGVTKVTISNTGFSLVSGSINLLNATPVRYYDADNSNYVSFQAPSVLGADYQYTLPSNYGVSGQVLTTNGTGGLIWSTVSGGGGGGGITFITAGTGLTGGTITTNGTIGLANTGVSAGTYNVPKDIIVNSQGQIVAISNGTATLGTVTSVNATTNGTAFIIGGTPITNSGTLTFNWNGSSSQYVKGDGTLALFPTITSGTVTSIAASIGGSSLAVAGSPITSSGTLAFNWLGFSNQYIKGDGTLATFPNIPAGQINSDWNATSGLGQILNKPNIITPVNADWNATSGLAQILNKPTIPAQINLIGGANVTISGTYPNLTIDSFAGSGGGGGGSVVAVGATTTGGALVVSGSPITTTGTLAFTWSGTTSQYVRGDGSLATLTLTGNYIPLAGTDAGFPVTGSIKINQDANLISNSNANNILSLDTASSSGKVRLAANSIFEISSGGTIGTSSGYTSISGSGSGGGSLILSRVTSSSVPSTTKSIVLDSNGISLRGQIRTYRDGTSTLYNSFINNLNQSTNINYTLPPDQALSSSDSTHITVLSATPVGINGTDANLYWTEIPINNNFVNLGDYVNETITGVKTLLSPPIMSTFLRRYMVYGGTTDGGPLSQTAYIQNLLNGLLGLGIRMPANTVNVNGVPGAGGEGAIRMYSGSNSNYVEIRASHSSIANNVTLTLPLTAGTSGQVLVTDGTGVLSWANQSGGGGGTGSVTSVQATVTPSTALTVNGGPITISGTLGFTWTGTNTQYIKGDGTLGILPTGSTTTNPAGANTEIQFNNNGVFGSNPQFKYDAINSAFIVGVRTFLGFGASPSGNAILNIKGTLGLAPIQLTSTSLIPIAINGSIEYDGIHFYGTASGVRKQLDNQVSALGGTILQYVRGDGSLATFPAETDPLYTANGVPKVRTITINGVTQDLSANRSWTISGGGGAGVTVMGPVGTTPNPNAGTITGSVLTLQPASALYPGVVTTGDQQFSGNKYLAQNGADPVNIGSQRNSWGLFFTARMLVGGTATNSDIAIYNRASTSSTTGFSELYFLKTGGPNLMALASDGSYVEFPNLSTYIKVAGVNRIGFSTGSTVSLPSLTTTGSGYSMVVADKTTGVLSIQAIPSGGGGDGGVLTMSAIGNTPNANAGTITGTVLNLQPASETFGGVITANSDQFFSGNKGLGQNGTTATTDYFTQRNSWGLFFRARMWNGTSAFNNDLAIYQAVTTTPGFSELKITEFGTGDIFKLSHNGTYLDLPITNSALKGAGVTRLVFGTSNTITAPSLASGTTTMMVTASSTGVLGFQAIPTSTGGITTVGVVGSTPNANGASITGTTLTLQPADSTNAGLMTTGTQTLSGSKTFPTNVSIGTGAADSNSVFAVNKVYTGIGDSNATSTVYVGSRLDINSAPAVDTVSGYEARAAYITAQATGSFSSYCIDGAAILSLNNSNALVKSLIGFRSSTGKTLDSASGNVVNAYNVLGYSYTYLTSSSLGLTIDNVHNFASLKPYKDVSGGFTVNNLFGFFCSDFSTNTEINPINDLTGKPVATINGSRWQFFAKGTQATNSGSYIGNKVGIGFDTEPANTNAIGALLHIGKATAGLTSLRVDGNMSLFAAPANYGGGDKVLFIAKCTAEPTTNPTNGVFLWVDPSGNLKAKGSLGTNTTVASV
jgi:hypothetical protein